MILTTRKKHRLIWIILAVLLPAILVTGLALRHEEPVNNEIPQIKRMGGIPSE